MCLAFYCPFTFVSIHHEVRSQSILKRPASDLSCSNRRNRRKVAPRGMGADDPIKQAQLAKAAEKQLLEKAKSQMQQSDLEDEDEEDLAADAQGDGATQAPDGSPASTSAPSLPTGSQPKPKRAAAKAKSRVKVGTKAKPRSFEDRMKGRTAKQKKQDLAVLQYYEGTYIPMQTEDPDLYEDDRRVKELFDLLVQQPQLAKLCMGRIKNGTLEYKCGKYDKGESPAKSLQYPENPLNFANLTGAWKGQELEKYFSDVCQVQYDHRAHQHERNGSSNLLFYYITGTSQQTKIPENFKHGIQDFITTRAKRFQDRITSCKSVLQAGNIIDPDEFKCYKMVKCEKTEDVNGVMHLSSNTYVRA